MINYILNIVFTRRSYIENVRNAIAVYEYDQTEANLNKICLETHKLARFYNDIYCDQYEYKLGQFIWKLKTHKGSELAQSIYEYQLWLDQRVRSRFLAGFFKWVYGLKNLACKKFR